MICRKWIIEMSKIENYLVNIYAFLGPKVTRLLFISFLVGIFGFFVESTFVFVMQLFLLNLNLIDASSTFIPAWLPSGLYTSLILLILFGTMRGGVNWARLYFSGITQQTFVREKRSYLLRLALKNGLLVKDILSIFTEQTNQAGQVILQITVLVLNIASASLFLIYGFYLAPYEMSIGLFLIIIAGLPIRQVSSKIHNAGKGTVSEFDQVTQRLILGIKNLFLLRAYKLVDREIEFGTQSLIKYEKHYESYASVAPLVISLPQLTGTVIISLLTYLGVMHFQTPPMKLIAFFYLFVRLSQSLSEIIRALSLIRLGWGGLSILNHWLTLPIYNSSQNLENRHLNKTSSFSVSANNVSFSYDQSNQILSNINFKLNLGDCLVIRGESGSGKSTLLSLIIGIHQPTSGQILFNSNVESPSNLDEFIGYVGPEPFLIPGTISENLKYGLLSHHLNNFSLNDLQQACLDSNSLDFIQACPNKFETFIHDLGSLSTGQKQRLSIARAFLRKPKLLILDEATANLDENTERKIIESLKEKFSERITIIVTHKNTFNQIATQTIEL